MYVISWGHLEKLAWLGFVKLIHGRNHVEVEGDYAEK
jgi:hypothetical protein